jgi:signal transduction histidine kinase
MSSRWTESLRDALGLRLATWYAVIFVTSALTLVAVTYVLLAASLARYDRESIEAALVQYARAYGRGGVPALAREIDQGQLAVQPGPLLVRTLGPGRDVVFFTMPRQWRRFDLSQLQPPPLEDGQAWTTLSTGDAGDELEVLSVRLPDGTLLQVGKSTERRSDLLARFRRVLLVDLALVVVIALIGGAIVTYSGLQPLRALTETVRGIVRTGRTDARVPPSRADDALGELGSLVNQMLERIDTVVSGMRGALDNVAHDLRTPLTRLRGIAESALATDDPARQREALTTCVEESDRVVAMLHALMDISEAETGTMSLKREQVSLAGLVQQAVDLYEDVADDRGITIDAQVDPGLVACADRVRIRQVIANLLDNAIKYSRAGGRIVIRASAGHQGHRVLTTDRGSRIADRELEPRQAVVLSISDDGPGIAPDQLPLIWDRLYRGDHSRATRGLGLGLSLVRAIVRAHGGDVAVESGVGTGSTFEITLPVDPPLAAPGANLSHM